MFYQTSLSDTWCKVNNLDLVKKVELKSRVKIQFSLTFSTDFRRSRVFRTRISSRARLAFDAATLHSALSVRPSSAWIILRGARNVEPTPFPLLPLAEEEEINLERVTALKMNREWMI